MIMNNLYFIRSFSALSNLLFQILSIGRQAWHSSHGTMKTWAKVRIFLDKKKETRKKKEENRLLLPLAWRSSVYYLTMISNATSRKQHVMQHLPTYWTADDKVPDQQATCNIPKANRHGLRCWQNSMEKLKAMRRFVVYFHIGFAFASKIHYLCLRESAQVLSLFSCFAAKACAIGCKTARNLHHITCWYATKHCVIWRKTQDHLMEMATLQGWNEQTKSGS